MSRYALGVDIGGSGIKAAVVDVDAGELAADRVREKTPKGARPGDVAEVAASVVQQVLAAGPEPTTGPTVGVGFPAVVQHGVTRTAANVHDDWVDAPAARLLTEALGRPAVVANDADVAGLAEVRFGAGRDVEGTIVVTTLGTGIGSALFVDGRLVPNTEFGHLEIDGEDAEKGAADSAREREDLSWKDWARRLQRYYALLELLLQPDLIIVGGGVSKKHDKFLPLLELRTPLVPAELRNEAGIIGAAVMAAELDTGGRTDDTPARDVA
ncbi:polyphosphate--glucose phosphotransferase [Aquipuribacter nitratireducens]|uniref:Polyphosphate--glucose phosphotransferase n=1 Tax=Aquipuribacter nitratireducens TaxID=650104 RepID=A0ABW0GJ81_9MICO